MLGLQTSRFWDPFQETRHIPPPVDYLRIIATPVEKEIIAWVQEFSDRSLEHSPDPQPTVCEVIPFILGFGDVWGMLQGYVGVPLDRFVSLVEVSSILHPFECRMSDYRSSSWGLDWCRSTNNRLVGLWLCWGKGYGFDADHWRFLPKHVLGLVRIMPCLWPFAKKEKVIRVFELEQILIKIWFSSLSPLHDIDIWCEPMLNCVVILCQDPSIRIGFFGCRVGLGEDTDVTKPPFETWDATYFICRRRSF